MPPGSTPHKRSFAAILIPVWLVTAVSDFVGASALSVFALHSTFARLWQGVAFTVVGARAMGGGAGMVFVGLGLHLAVALTWSALFVLALRLWPALRRALRTSAGAVGIATVYGPCIWLVMSLVVIPLATQRAPKITGTWWLEVVVHIPFVTLPMVFCARRLLSAELHPMHDET